MGQTLNALLHAVPAFAQSGASMSTEIAAKNRASPCHFLATNGQEVALPLAKQS